MDYNGLIITGTSGAGKSTVARKLSEQYKIFQIVQAVTTRELRTDDKIGEYKHLNRKEFEKLRNEEKLLIEAEYREERYGITHEALKQTINDGKVPIMVITPKSASEFEADKCNHHWSFLTIFVDAPDDIINKRLKLRVEEIDKAIEEQRPEDREYGKVCLYAVKNLNLEKSLELIQSLWEYRKTGGVLPKRLIQLMIECGMLLGHAEVENIKGASYDLSLGDEYYYGGKIKNLTNKEPFILIEPYDYSIVTSRETPNLPKDTIGRFDLSVGLFCQGVILSNGPQIDPGFRGRLFCLLFNTSNAPIFLKRGQHYATLEFHKLVEPTIAYSGKYQDKQSIVYYLPSNTMRGGINELKKELERITRESRLLQSTFLGVISLILAIIAILLVIR